MIVYYKGFARSSASPLLSLNRINDVPEHVSVFRANAYGKEITSRTIAHEFLHLYGAWDLYYDDFYGLSKEFNHLYNWVYKSIMHGGKNNLKKLKIDALSAWRIGLNNEPEDWFLDVIPKVYIKKSDYYYFF